MASFDGSGDLSQHQAGSKSALDSQSSRILVDDTVALWDHLSARRGGRVDIVLDNAAFELFTDLCLAHWLVEAGLAARYVEAM